MVFAFFLRLFKESEIVCKRQQIDTEGSQLRYQQRLVIIAKYLLSTRNCIKTPHELAN